MICVRPSVSVRGRALLLVFSLATLVVACGRGSDSAAPAVSVDASAGTGVAVAADVPGRSTGEQPDDSTEAQIKVMYVLPSDATDRQLDVDGTLERSIASTQAWMVRQTGGPQMRYDTAGGALDIGFLRLSRTDADMASTGLYLRDAIEQELAAAGWDAPNKLYEVFYDGTSQGVCGGGAWPPTRPGKVAAQYLRGTVPAPAPPCGSQPIGGSTEVPAYLDIAALHEVFHTLGAVATCAPHHTRAGHVSDGTNDFMYAGDAPWGQPQDLILDIGKDDYWGHTNAGCLDVAKSAFVDPLPTDPQLPPGWPATGAGDLFHPLDAPTRVLDSRPPPEQVGPYGSAWAPGTVREVPVAGVGGVPADATAVTLNVTVTGTSAASFLTIWPAGADQPTASNLNWAAGQTIANAVTVKVGAGGRVGVFNPSGNVNVIFDVVGYYDQAGSGDGFTAQAPVRVLDSRPPPEQVGPYGTPWGPGADRAVTVVGGATGVPADADAVVANVTVTATSAESFLTVYPDGAADKPTASSLNWTTGQTVPNAVTVKVGTGGKIRVFNNSGTAHVIIDVVGYFAAGAGDAFHPVDPVRFQDSRPAPDKVGAYGSPWPAATARTVAVTTANAVPSGAKAVLANVTVTGATAESFLTVWNTGAPEQPTASSLNFRAGVTIANAVTAKVGTGNTISVFNNSGTVHVIADAAGWYG